MPYDMYVEVCIVRVIMTLDNCRVRIRVFRAFCRRVFDVMDELMTSLARFFFFLMICIGIIILAVFVIVTLAIFLGVRFAVTVFVGIVVISSVSNVARGVVVDPECLFRVPSGVVVVGDVNNIFFVVVCAGDLAFCFSNVVFVFTLRSR